MWHDAGSQEDFKTLGYESAEDYAGFLFGESAKKHNFGAEEIEAGQHLISKTKQGAKPFTLAEKIIVKADIYNVGTNDFTERTEDFINEERQRKEKQKQVFLWDVFASNNIKTLAAYLVHDLTLWDGDTQWTVRAFHNFNQYVIKTADRLGLKPAKYVSTLGNSAVHSVFARGTYSDKHGGKV